MTKRFCCTSEYWERYATNAAVEANLNPVKFLAGDRHRKYGALRWRLWRDLDKHGFSYASVGKASGFNHASIRYACIAKRDPWTGRQLVGDALRTPRVSRTKDVVAEGS